MIEVALAIVQFCRHRSPLALGGSIVETFLRWNPKARTVTAVPKLSAIRRKYKNRDDAIRVEYESGAYSYQQIATEFEVHFTTVGKNRAPAKKAGERNPWEKVADGPLVL